MSFTLAIVLISALAVAALGLVVYHLLGRLHLIESAVQGGMQPPSRRLSREEFERQFTVARARANLASRFDTGLVVLVDSANGTSTAMISTLQHLPRHDLVHVVACDAQSALMLNDGSVPHLEARQLEQPLTDLGISTLPFAFVLDDGSVRATSHLASPEALAELLREYA